MTRPSTPQLNPKRASSRALLAAVAILALSLPQGLSAGGVVSIPFNASNFSNPLVIDNEFLPMVPGTTQTYRAEGADGCEVDVFEVTNDTKTITIGGSSIQVRVIHDVGYEDPECNGTLEKHEETFDWHGQDNAGNVWYFGEDTRNCTPAGCTPGGGSWEAGVDGAKPGIIMLAHPDSGDKYYQEFYAGHAEDQAKVTGVDTKVILKREDAWPGSPFTGCLKTKEWSALSPGDVEQKYYCPGLGNVAVDEHHGKELRFELIDPSFGALRFRKVR
jgi:hypothetical protein